jgi:hypothetical protein
MQSGRSTDVHVPGTEETNTPGDLCARLVLTVLYFPFLRESCTTHCGPLIHSNVHGLYPTVPPRCLPTY